MIQYFRPRTDPEHWLTDQFQGQPCYYCADPLTSPFIAWFGVGEPVGLHPPCVAEWIIRLARDVHEYEKAHGYVTRPLDRLADLRAKLAARNGGAS